VILLGAFPFPFTFLIPPILPSSFSEPEPKLPKSLKNKIGKHEEGDKTSFKLNLNLPYREKPEPMTKINSCW